MKIVYGIKYQKIDYPVRTHRTINAAERDLNSCRALANRNGDRQSIRVVVVEGEIDEYVERNLACVNQGS